MTDADPWLARAAYLQMVCPMAADAVIHTGWYHDIPHPCDRMTLTLLRVQPTRENYRLLQDALRRMREGLPPKCMRLEWGDLSKELSHLIQERSKCQG